MRKCKVAKDFIDLLTIHNLMREMVIGINCFNEWEGTLVINNYPDLERIVVGKNSLKNMNSLCIRNNEKLRSIQMNQKAFYYLRECSIQGIHISI